MTISKIQSHGMKRNIVIPHLLICLLCVVTVAPKSIRNTNAKNLPLVFCVTLLINMATVQPIVLIPIKNKKKRETNQFKNLDRHIRININRKIANRMLPQNTKSKRAPSVKMTLSVDFPHKKHQPVEKIDLTVGETSDYKKGTGHFILYE